MKTKFVLTTIFTFIFAAAAFAQADVSATANAAQKKTTDYSGKWVLDVSKSKMNERQRIESMTMTVSQNEKELSIESAVKRAEDEDAGQIRGGMGGMRRGQFGGMGGGNEATVYILDGKEVVNDMTKSAAGKMTYKANLEKDGKLKLEQTREFQSPTGEMKIKTNETWSLSPEGKTLTVKKDTTTPRGNISSEMIFTKQ